MFIYSYENIFELLKKREGDVNAKDKAGLTPLLYAVCSNSLRTVNYLLDIGADITLKTNHDQTVLHYAAMYADTNVLEVLVNR